MGHGSQKSGQIPWGGDTKPVYKITWGGNEERGQMPFPQGHHLPTPLHFFL